MKRSSSLIAVLSMLLLFCGCTKHLVYEVITSFPEGAGIYWGKTADELMPTPYTTLNSRSMEGEYWESWCYQVRKRGYLPSKIVCRPDGDENRTINFFKLEKIKTKITSDPSDAQIYWGESPDNLRNTRRLTPWIEDGANSKANYENWYFQVKKAGYEDSEVIYAPLAEKDRAIHIVLEPSE
ncbi:hypothetical protein [Desulfosarcina ovata]|nr:hypothetical protein [Desulfosarcina ovata]